jgi:inorganic pyrophosphatase
MAGLVMALVGVFFMCSLTAVTEASLRWKRDIPVYGSLYQKEFRGSEYTKDFRIFARDKDGQLASYWHDIPIFNDEANKIYNMVIEVPKWTNARFESVTIDKEPIEPLAPIKQRVRNGELYFQPNIYPMHGSIRNYGSLPQTFVDPDFIWPLTDAKGESESLDIFEIGDRIGEPGDVIPVKILGVLPSTDDGLTDYKIIAIDTRDRVADQMNNIEDVERVKPGLLADIRKMIVHSKAASGGDLIPIPNGGRFAGKDQAEQIIALMHGFWQKLIETPVAPYPTFNRVAALYPGAQEKLSQAEAEAFVKSFPEPGPPAPLDTVKLGRSYYVEKTQIEETPTV